MKTTIDILLILLCLLILIQDLRERMINIFSLALTGLLLSIEFVVYYGVHTNYTILLCNVLFVCGQLIFLYFYLVHLRRNKLSFFRELMGWGDIIMMLLMTLVFPLPQLIIYLLSSFAAGILFAILFARKKTGFSIPLAGIMAFVFAFNLALFYTTGYALIEFFAT